MFNVNEERESITFRLTSEMRLVDRVVRDVAEYLKQYDVFELANFNMVLRELLNNAIEHGNKNVVERLVTCCVEHLQNTRFKITVEDEGSGFDHKKVDLTIPQDPLEPRSRGYGLINAFADEIGFNKAGNQVTAYFHFTSETGFKITEEDGWQVISPTGDVTSSVVDKFRTLLISLIDKGHTRYRFDLIKVEDIDSVSLSVFILFAKMLTKQKTPAELVIVNANRDLVNLFQMTRLNKAYRVMTSTGKHNP
ncbi:MAG: ATP-binding protein [Deltaproteobacteria bacterium]|nr:ATP-binding protein [Deltaproteobacteria bacterium]